MSAAEQSLSLAEGDQTAPKVWHESGSSQAPVLPVACNRVAPQVGFQVNIIRVLSCREALEGILASMLVLPYQADVVLDVKAFSDFSRDLCRTATFLVAFLRTLLYNQLTQFLKMKPA